MLGHLYLLTHWAKVHKGIQRIYIINNPTKDRQTGGKYSSPNGKIVHEIRGVFNTKMGNSEMDLQRSGIVKTALNSFHIPQSEFTRIGISPSQPELELYLENAAYYRVINTMKDASGQFWRMMCERTRDEFPVFAFAWSLVDASEPPSGWEVYDLATSVSFDTNGMHVENKHVEEETTPTISVDLQEFVHAPACSFSFKLKVSATLTTDAPISTIVLGDAAAEGATGIKLILEVSTGEVLVKYGQEDEVAITVDEWHDVVITDTTITIDDAELATVSLGTNGMWLFVEGFCNTDDGGGALATTSIKDVEVSCVHAL